MPMYEKKYILMSITKSGGRPTNTSCEDLHEALVKARRAISSRTARPIAIVDRFGNIEYTQLYIEQWANDRRNK